MFDKREEESMMRALMAARCGALPTEFVPEEDRLWLRAIVKVKKYDGSTSYCLAENYDNIKPHITVDYGTTAIIKAVVAIYPYEFVRDMPMLSSKKAIVSYLVSNGYPEEDITQLAATTKADGTPKTDAEKKLDNATLKKSVIRTVLTQELNMERNER